MTQKAIDRIRKAVRDRRRSFEVPEWDLTLFFRPVTTADMIAVGDHMVEEYGLNPEKHQLEKRICLLIQKAELEDGTPAFAWGDRLALQEEADWGTLQKVIAFMYSSTFIAGSADEVDDEAKKGSARTQISASE